MSGRRWAILGVVGVLLVGSAFIGGRVLTSDEPDVEYSCTGELHLGQIADGTTYMLEDQSGPGPDRCDVDADPNEVRGGGGVGPGFIGYDCKLHGPDATTDTVMAPNRSDGTCGQAGE